MKKLLFLLVFAVATAAWAWVLTHPAAPPEVPPSGGLVLGLSAFLGLSVAVIASLVAMVVRGLVAPRPQLVLDDPDERVLAAVPANHWLGPEARGGRLYLTTRCLRFVPHRFNFQRDTASISLEIIARVGAGGGLKIQAADGAVSVFVVPDPRGLADALIPVLEAGPESRGPPAPPWLPVDGEQRVLQARGQRLRPGRGGSGPG